MNNLKIKGIESLFVVESGNIYNVNIENLNYYKQIAFDIINEEYNYFTYSENYIVKKIDKEVLLINDTLQLNPNSKKILNTLYKKINDNYNLKYLETIASINTKIINLLDEISLDINTETNYDLELDLSKLLATYKFEFRNDSTIILEKIVTYIKANLEISNFKFIICLNTIPLLSEQELELLSKELEMLGLAMINVNLIYKNNNKYLKTINIDNDLCEF